MSLACGIANKYVALAAYYNNSNFEYVGIENDANTCAQTLEIYKNFPNFHLISCDAADSGKISENLLQRNLMPTEGFDIVFLRHPDVLSSISADAFKKMLETIIPYCASKKSLIYISCYNEAELQRYREILSCNALYQTLKSNYVINRNFINFEFSEPIYIDQFTIVLNCKGLAFNQKPLQILGHSAFFIKNSNNISNPIESAIEKLAANLSDPLFVREPLARKDYNLILRRAVSLGAIAIVATIIKHKNELGIDLAATINGSSLEDVACALTDENVKEMMLKILSQTGMKLKV